MFLLSQFHPFFIFCTFYLRILCNASRFRCTHICIQYTCVYNHLNSQISSSPFLSLSDSDSDEENATIVPMDYSTPTDANSYLPLQPNDAPVAQANSSIPPVLSNDTILITSLLKYECLCLHYFQVKKVPTTEQIERILDHFNHEDVVTWIVLNYSRLETKTFSEFILKLHQKSLPVYWEIPLAQEVCSHQSSVFFAQ